jgi:hypothetical protein
MRLLLEQINYLKRGYHVPSKVYKMIELWKRDSSIYGLSLKNMTKEANSISRFLKGYYSERIADGDEPVFYFHKSLLSKIQNILKTSLKSEN